MAYKTKIVLSCVALTVIFCILPGISYASTYHVVEPKDTLWKISKMYGLTVDELYRLNNLQSDLIFPGQSLLVSKDENEAGIDVESAMTEEIGEVGNAVEENATGEATAEEEKDLAAQIIDFAKTFLGTPYRSAGSSPKGFDCSGFTYYVYKQFGIELPRVAQDQYYFGKTVSANEAKAGDLVAFAYKGYIHHVGIYMGNGEFIHSSSTEGIVITKTSDAYWGPRVLGYCRVLE